MQPESPKSGNIYHLDQVLNRVPCGFLTFTDDGKIVAVNAMLLQLLGYDLDELREQQFASILPIASRIFYQTHLSPLLRLQGKVEEIYLSLKSKQGEALPVLMNAVRQERLGVLVNDCIFVPMRQRGRYEDELLQAREAAETANSAKSQFLSKMSHELRTPLTAILGFTELMRASSDMPTEFQEHLGIISESGEHLLTLINDVLEMSKIEAGKVVLNESQFDLFDLIHSVEKLFALKASAKGLRLKVEQDQGLPRHLYGDEAKLRQILINLLSNAIKLTQAGAVTLRVSIVHPQLSSVSSGASRQTAANPDMPHDKEPVMLQFEVEDTGCGIKAADIESIFEAFVQTEQGRRAQGTGLGLSITRQFARLMSGDITVSSTPNQGSTFTCQVMMHLPEFINPVEPEVNRVVIGLEPGQSSYRILVAEDVPENRQFLKTFLESAGFEVKTVENGAEAISQWQSWHPSLMFMDIHMPVMDGYEATRRIRVQEASEQRQQTPIIALTASAFKDDLTTSLEAGCNEHLTKPFNKTTIFQVIAHYLGVHYRYRDDSSPPVLPTQKVLAPQDFKVMPRQWINQVYAATIALQDEQLRQLIAQIPPNEQRLSDSLTALVEDFQLEAIAALTRT